MRIKSNFFNRHPVIVASELIGKDLKFNTGSKLFTFTIVETEAYAEDDPASHSFKGPNKRNQLMFEKPGLCYVYLIYGMYHCLNFVTEEKGIGSAVLIRELRPEFDAHSRLFNGPGKICRQLNIDLNFNGEDLSKSKRIWITDSKHTNKFKIIRTPRIGISKAQDRLWRFVLDK